MLEHDGCLGLSDTGIGRTLERTTAIVWAMEEQRVEKGHPVRIHECDAPVVPRPDEEGNCTRSMTPILFDDYVA